MRRTTIYLEPELEVLLKLEMLRQKRPMAEIIREAIHSYLSGAARQAPPGAGDFASGTSETAERMDDVLRTTGFGGAAAPRRPPRRRTAKRR